MEPNRGPDNHPSNQDRPRLTGLTAATYTPFDSGGALRLQAIEPMAAHLLSEGVTSLFVCGTTGECHSLSLEERLQLAARWVDVARGTRLRVIVQVGSNSLPDATEMARQAARLGAFAVSAMPPSYFRPETLDALVTWCGVVAEAAGATPFFYYDIPSMTRVHFQMHEFLAGASSRIPNLAGLKFSNPDLLDFQLCLQTEGGRFDIPWGTDEALLAAVAVGGKAAVGSSYNFVAGLNRRLLAAAADGCLEAARGEQLRAVRVTKILYSRGYMRSCKALMSMLGVEVGAPRPPFTGLSKDETESLRRELEQIGFFDWRT